jgi:hypothetical protein
MGWETRHKGRRYLYRNRRVGGKPVKEYIAADDDFLFGHEQAEQLERELQCEAQLRQTTRKAKADYPARIDKVLRLVEAANAELRTFVEGILYAIEFHNHHRGEWRMNRSIFKEIRQQVNRLKEQVEASTKPLINYQAPAADAEALEVFKEARGGGTSRRRKRFGS